ITGEQFSVQANLMANDAVWPAMAKAYREAKGELVDRMLSALDAAQAAGGDIRGQQSAAILIVSGTPTGKSWIDRKIDLRVEDHPEPLKELRRLVSVHRAYARMNNSDLRLEKGDIEGALREYRAAEMQLPNNAEMQYWSAVSLVNAGRLEDALPLFRSVFAREPAWAELTGRLPKVDLLKADDATLTKILSVRSK